MWMTLYGYFATDNKSFVPFLQSARDKDIVIAVTHDDAARM